MFAPKWARGPHKLTLFHSWDPYITPGYWAWYLNVLPTSGSLIRSLSYVFMPREGIYTCVFCPPSSPQRRKPGYAALLRIRGNYFRPYLSIPLVCHRGAAYQWKFSYISCPERAYILAFFVCHSGFRRWAWPRLLTLSFLMFWKPFARLWYLLRVTFYSVSRF